MNAINKTSEDFGNIDVYLFDQLLKGNISPDHKIIDVGCGYGRNLYYFLKNNYSIYGLDANTEAIASIQEMAKALKSPIKPDQFKVEKIEELSFPIGEFDWVICNAVLHFAENRAHFEEQLYKIWALVKPGGKCFIRLASDIGIEDLVKRSDGGQSLLPDGSWRFLVNEKMLLDYTEKLNGKLYEYIKTTNVQNLRCMTTWVIQKD